MVYDWRVLFYGHNIMKQPCSNGQHERRSRPIFDSPVEDWSPHSSEQSIPFDRDLINRRLAALTVSGPEPARW